MSPTQLLGSPVCVTGLLGEELVHNGLFEWPNSGHPHKTLFEIEINLDTNFTKLVAEQRDTPAR